MEYALGVARSGPSQSAAGECYIKDRTSVYAETGYKYNEVCKECRELASCNNSPRGRHLTQL